MPFLTNLSVSGGSEGYPFSIPAIAGLENGIKLHPKVTYLVGENGMGKSTLLEGLADKWGSFPRNAATGARATGCIC